MTSARPLQRMPAEPLGWVTDTTTYTHLCRAGHQEIIAQLAPGGVVLVPTEVDVEIERGRDRYPAIPAVSSVEWARIVVLGEAELWNMLDVKAQMGGDPDEHLGECAVISCARHRGLIALLDERAAIAQAGRLNVPVRDTLSIVVEAYKVLFGCDRARAAKVVDDLLGTEMKLPIDSGESLFSWAYEEGLLP